MSQPTENELVPGAQVLGRYNVLGKLTQGGMAEVYLANQCGPAGYNKLVVIKRVRPHLANDSDFVAMFVNEARLAALINHPNVVSIFDLGQEKTDWLLAMEFLDGRDMLQVGRACRQHNKAVPFDVTARIIADACAGLEHAHNLHGQDGQHLNLVHRDMSPENILITFEGSVKVVDFGIAKARDNAFRTQAGQIKGKLGYVAPEAILGKTLDARADIFAIGATLYLLLCGRPAFTGNNPMEIFEKSLQPPTPPRQINSRVPEALETICLRCLAQDRDQRYATCGELRQALEAHLASSGRPLGPAQLAQFMKILFPAESDPVRQRINQLIAHGNAIAAQQAQAAPTADPALFEGDKTVAQQPHPATAQGTDPSSYLSSQASMVSEEKTAVVVPSREATAAPASIEFNSQEPQTQQQRSQSFGHLRSVDIGDEIEAERQARRSGGQPAPAPAPPTVEIDDNMDVEVEIDATMVNREYPERPPSIEISASLDLPPPPIDEAPVITDEGAPVGMSDAMVTDEGGGVPPEMMTAESAGPPSMAPHTNDDMVLPAVALQQQLEEQAAAQQPPMPQSTGAFVPPPGQMTTEPVIAGPNVVHVPAPLAARAAMFLLGVVVGAGLLAGGLYVIGDLETVLAYAGVQL